MHGTPNYYCSKKIHHRERILTHQPVLGERLEAPQTHEWSCSYSLPPATKHRLNARTTDFSLYSGSSKLEKKRRDYSGSAPPAVGRRITNKPTTTSLPARRFLMKTPFNNMTSSTAGTSLRPFYTQSFHGNIALEFRTNISRLVAPFETAP